MNKKELKQILRILESELTYRKGYYRMGEELNSEDKELNLLVIKLAKELNLFDSLEPFNQNLFYKLE